MKFACYADWNQLPESAEVLHSRAACDSIFFSRTWFDNLLRHAPVDPQRLLLACVVEDGQILALLPLEMRSGQHGYALTHLYSSLYTLLLAEHRQREAIECLARGLSGMPFASLRLAPIAGDDEHLRCFQQAMESLGITCQRAFRFHNWIHRTRGQTFDEYMAARPARVRNSLARKERKLDRDHGYTIRLATGSGLQRAMADYHAVYRRSWKANELYGDFIEGLARGLSEQGWLRLAILYVEGRPIAAQFWFVAHGKAGIFKLVHDEDWKRYSPGSILTRWLMRHVIDHDRVTEIDFLTGNDAYKQDWMSERRERWALYCINRREPRRGVSRMAQWLLGSK
ncbi:GNAT family N-acetyltransferase [Thioalkalivibrio denitrificans]|uniref:GNAT family N-acetyltransferase n=1 Tax=Thioalkalivibrio denitrificans TaxID=108003 RepID=A0A1V3NDC9_9GAMM|nr:GNAT family N-acetyltransferase [Thioalkalivibrio denitrificans]OOG23051.1 GNAT family N-acetyltransferase [Thioalkalivibrio denitrificans]